MDAAGDVQLWRTDWDAGSDTVSNAVSTKLVHIRDINARRVDRLFPYADGFLLPIERWRDQPYGHGNLELRYIDLKNDTAQIIEDLGPTKEQDSGIDDTLVRTVLFQEFGDNVLLRLIVFNPYYDNSTRNVLYQITEPTDDTGDRIRRFARLGSATTFVEFGGKAYFFRDPGNDYVDFVLYELDPATRRIDRILTMPNVDMSLPRGLTVVEDRLYFAFGNQLWTSDGTAEGTEVLEEFSDNSVNAASFTAIDKELVFEVSKGNRQQIWATDGTTEGTRRLPTEDPRSSLSYVGTGLVDREQPVPVDAGDWDRVGNVSIRQIEGELWVQSILDGVAVNLGPDFRVVGQQRSRDIVVSDGQQFYRVQSRTLHLTPSFSGRLNTELLEVPGTVSEELTILGQSSGKLLLSDGWKLFVLAAEAPTSLVALEGSAFAAERTDDLHALGVTFVDSGMYFVDAANGHLWRRSHAEGALEQLTRSDHRFDTTPSWGLTCEPFYRVAVWESDGSVFALAQDNVYTVDPAGTFEAIFADGFDLSEFESQFNEDYDRANVNPFVFADDENIYWGIRRQLNKITLGDNEPDVSHLREFFYDRVHAVSLNGDLVVNSRLWGDGELFGVGDSDLKRSNVSGILVDGERLFFLHKRGAWQLWETDGTPTGSKFLSTFTEASSETSPTSIVKLGDNFIFNDGSGKLIRSNGTPEGTVVLKQFSDKEGGLIAFLNRMSDFVANEKLVFFVAYDPEFGKEIWVTDGTADGTRLAVDLRSGPQSSVPEQLSIWNDTLYFVANAGDEVGREIWTIDLRQQPSTGVEADIDGDGVVGVSDFAILSAAFGQEGSDPFLAADIDRDGIVGFSDFLILSSNYGHL